MQQNKTPQTQEFIGNLDLAEVLVDGSASRVLALKGWLAHTKQKISAIHVGVISGTLVPTTLCQRTDVEQTFSEFQSGQVVGFSGQIPVQAQWALPLPIVLVTVLESGEAITSTFSYVGTNNCQTLNLFGNKAEQENPAAVIAEQITNVDFFGEQERQAMLLEVIEQGNSLVGVFQADGVAPEQSILEAEKLLSNCREIPRVVILDRFEKDESNRKFPPLIAEGRSLENTAKSVCVVCTAESASESGTPSLVLANFLAEMGHTVTIAYSPSMAGLLKSSGSLSALAAKGISCIEIPTSTIQISADTTAKHSYEVYRWLEKQRFNWVHFEDKGGLGYYSMLAKRQGLSFHNSALCAGIYGPTSLTRENSKQHPSSLSEITREYLERRTIELSDAAYCASPTMLSWLAERGWEFPTNTYLLVDPLALARTLPGLSESSLVESSSKGGTAEGNSAEPLVSICLLHQDNPELLERSLRSIEGQDYPNIELIIADNASSDQASIDYLQRITEKFSNLKPIVLCRSVESRGAARNIAALHASGQYLVFIDHTQVLMPDAISTFIAASANNKADVFTACLDRLPNGESSLELQMQRVRFLPVGGPPSAGAFGNCFGDGAICLRREIFLAVGGFTIDMSTPCELWELLAETTLRGYRLEVVPKSLTQTCLENPVLTAEISFANTAQVLRPYMHAAPATLRELIVLAHGMANSQAGNTSASDNSRANTSAMATEPKANASMLENQIEVERWAPNSADAKTSNGRTNDLRDTGGKGTM